MSAEQRFADLVLQGIDLDSALYRVAAERKQSNPLEALRDSINQVHVGFVAPTMVMRDVVDGGGSVADIPKPSCLRNHLPSGRKPTREELVNAWRLCLKK